MMYQNQIIKVLYVYSKCLKLGRIFPLLLDQSIYAIILVDIRLMEEILHQLIGIPVVYPIS